VAGEEEVVPAKQDARKVIQTLFNTIAASNRGGVGEAKQRGAKMRKWGRRLNTRMASNGVNISKIWHRGLKTESGCGSEPALEK
jgi:histidinol phosphatase-like enzyme